MPLLRQKPWLPEKAPSDLLFANANVIDVAGNAVLSRRTVHVSFTSLPCASSTGGESLYIDT
jgi:hypothetical protein